MNAVNILEKHGIQAAVCRILSVKPLPIDEIKELLAGYTHVVVIEEVAGNCGMGQSLAWQLQQYRTMRVDCIDLGDKYVPHGSVDKLYEHCKLDAESIAQKILEVHSNEK